MSANIVYAGKYNINPDCKSIFLAGPTPRSSKVMDGCDKIVPSWRPRAIGDLEWLGFTGNIFVPETKNGAWPKYDDQLTWEDNCLTYADCIIFWIPRDMETLPGLTTNDEWGYWKKSGKCVLGAPPDAHKVRYQKWWAEKLGVPFADRLDFVCDYALYFVNYGEHRNTYPFNNYPEDYEPCGECGYDHEYEYEEAYKWHVEHDSDYCAICGSRHSEQLACQIAVVK